MQYLTSPRRASRTVRTFGLALAALSSLAGPARVLAAPDAGALALPGHVPAAVARAQAVSRLDGSRPVSLALTLPLRNQSELSDLLRRLYDPGDPLYGRYLSPEQFTAKFGPTQADYNRAIAYAQAMGLTVTNTHTSRTLLDVSAPAATVENAFGLHLLVFQSQEDGRYFYAPDSDPKIPASLASVLSGVVGLDNVSVRRPHYRVLTPRDPSVPVALQPFVLPRQTGSGPGGGLSPSDIKTAYNLSGVTQTGSGQTLGLFELDGYTASDITAYETQYGLPAVPLTNVLLDGFNGNAGSGAGEVTLDIELQIALAPQASGIIVYEADNSGQGVLDAYQQIATDNKAKNISTSWGTWEDNYGGDPTFQEQEYPIFQQMAAQGQSIYAATGDYGAYNPSTGAVSAQDPATQPFMCAVGGTTLTTTKPGGPYRSETTWAESARGIGSGGGISTVWSIPSYQTGFISAASQGSTTMRNVPDVSLDADPDNSGYSIYFGGAWTIEGGTSCAAPLWAAFNALVNQKRVAGGKALLGFANPPIYTDNADGYSGTDFHDIADGSTNFVYPAVRGLDDATGWGSFNGANLLTHLYSLKPTTPKNLKATDGNAQVFLTWSVSPYATTYNLYRSTVSGKETLYRQNIRTNSYTDTGVVNGRTYYYKVSAVNSAGESGLSNEAVAYPQVAKQFLSNGGFENGSSKPAPWTASPGVIDDTDTEPAYDGNWKAYLDGYGVTHTDTLASPYIKLPSPVTTVTLSCYLDVDTSETTTTTKYDTLTFQIRDQTGKVLGTVASYSNLTNTDGFYVPVSLDLSAYQGKTIQLDIIGKEDNSMQTSFLLDDFSLIAQ